MKYLFFTILVLISTLYISAQNVSTFSGLRDSIGASDGVVSEATFYNPHGIAVSQNGTVYVCDRFNHIIRKISIDGVVSTLAGTAGAIGDVDGIGADAMFYEPWGLCVDFEENVYVADTRNNKIRKITPEGAVSTFAGTGNYGITNGPANSSTFGLPSGIETDNQGNFYIADHGTNIIRKINPDGQVSTLAGSAYLVGDDDGFGEAAKFNRPYGLTLDLDGDIIVADEWNHKIRKVTPVGEVTTIAGLGGEGGIDGTDSIATFNYPWDVAVDSNGYIYVADGLNHAIRKIIIDVETEVSTFAGVKGSSGNNDGAANEAKFSGATGVAFSPLSQEIFVADAFNNIIRRITDPDQGLFLVTNNLTNSFCPEELIEVAGHPNNYNQYHFYIDDVLIESTSNPVFNITDLESGTHLFKTIADLDSLQITSEELVIEIFDTPQAEIDTVGETTFFEGDSVILIASYGIEYFWSDAVNTAANTIRESGIYSVEIIDGNDCLSRSEEIVVTVRLEPEEISISALGSTILCDEEFVELITNQSNNVQWLKNGWPITGANESSFIASESGLYNVQYEDVLGTVVISDLIEVVVNPHPDIDFIVDSDFVKPNEPIQFHVLTENLNAVEWTFGDNTNEIITDFNPIYKYSEEGVFSVTLKGVDENDCSDVLIKENRITVTAEGVRTQDDVFVASAFTPNGDGNNDFLYVRGSDIAEMNIKIYNRRGALLFESSSKETGWDGMVSNKKAPIGNYIYQLSYTDLLGVRKKNIGKIALLK